VNGDGIVDLSDLEAVDSNPGKSLTPEVDLNSGSAGASLSPVASSRLRVS